MSSKLTCLSFSTLAMFYWFIYLYMANKKIKEKIKEKEKMQEINMFVLKEMLFQNKIMTL